MATRVPVTTGSVPAGPAEIPPDRKTPHSTEDDSDQQEHASESKDAKRRGSRRSAARTKSPRDPAKVSREELTVEDLDAVEDDDAALLDLPRLHADAKLRRQTMEENMPKTGRTMDNIDKTYASNVIKLIAGSQQALANALRALANERADLLDDLTASNAYKRKALCKQVQKGDYDL